MDEFILNGWLSREELILHRMRSFHRNRVEELKSGQSRDKQEKNGKLVIHCIPEQAIVSRTRYSVRELSKHSQELKAPNCSYWNPRINADGFACSDSPNGFSGYSQVYRDGRFEAVMTRATFSREQVRFLCDSACERAILQVTKQYLAFCKAIGIAHPIWLFCTLVDVEGARYHSEWDHEGHVIDRPVVELPELEIAVLDIIVDMHLRPLLDCIWNAIGIEASLNYDEAGNRRERRQ
jgi:hypothetical protein